MTQTNYVEIRCQGRNCHASERGDGDLPVEVVRSKLAAEMVNRGWLVWEHGRKIMALCPVCKEVRR